MFLVDPQFLSTDMPQYSGGYYLPFHTDHLDQFGGINEYGGKDLTFDQKKQMIEYQSQLGPTITAFVSGKPVAVFGCVLHWQGLGEGWALFDDKARRYPIAMTKGARVFFKTCYQSYLLHRIQITVKKSDKRAISWAKCLGFETEGILEKYSMDKEDFYMMRRLHWAD